ncbi:MAG: hypothetical protein WBD22_02695, partial [Pyrinomonadaceae bacterium]
LQDQKTDDYEVYSMAMDGSDPRNVSNNKDVAWSYYAYKDRLYFVSDRDACRRCYFLYRTDALGNGIAKISDLQLEDSWMGSRKKGREMIVSGRIGKDTRYQLFIINNFTGKYRQITSEPGAAFRDPSFSESGKQIIYVYKRNRLDRNETEELYIMDADGSNRRRLTTYPKDDKTAELGSYKAGPPQWSYKRGFITYQSNQKGKSSIYGVTPDGKRQWKVTENEHEEGWHDWSPDGKWIAFDARDAVTGRYDIYLMNYATKEVKNLTASSKFKINQAPVFVEAR